LIASASASRCSSRPIDTSTASAPATIWAIMASASALVRPSLTQASATPTSDFTSSEARAKRRPRLASANRLCVTFPQRCTKTLKKKPSEYLRQLYYDSLIFTPEGLRHLIAEVGASQIVLGTDYPFPWTTTAVDHILNTPGLSDNERVAMLGATPEKLLSIKPA